MKIKEMLAELRKSSEYEEYLKAYAPILCKKQENVTSEEMEKFLHIEHELFEKLMGMFKPILGKVLKSCEVGGVSGRLSLSARHKTEELTKALFYQAEKIIPEYRPFLEEGDRKKFLVIEFEEREIRVPKK